MTGLQPIRVTPNPANSDASISFQLERGGPVSCLVYDAAGNRVAQLADGSYAAGTHRLSWNAASVPPGIYLCQLETSAGSRTVRLVRAE